MQEGGHGESLGTVLTVDPVRMVATVRGTKDSVAPEMPFAGAVGRDGEGYFGTPMPGWHAVTGRRMGTDAIEMYGGGPTLFKNTAERDDYTDEVNPFITLTGTAKIYRKIEAKEKNFRSHRPTDLLAGDWGYRSPEGAMVYVGRGGVAGLKVSDLCQIVLNQVDDLLRLVTRNMDVFADWGEIRLVNDAGKTRLVMKGNARATETYDGRHQFEASIGDGDAFIDLKLMDAAGEGPVFTYKLDQKGNVHLYQKADRVEQVDGHRAMGVTKDHKVVVGGSEEYEVDGDQDIRIGGASVEVDGVKKTIKAPKVHLGGEGGEPAPMGKELMQWLYDFYLWITTQQMLMTTVGPTLPGSIAAGSVPPPIPPFLSLVVDYVKTPQA